MTLGQASSFRVHAAGACLVMLLTFAAYSNSFGVPFLFDDQAEIERNAALDVLWPVQVPMFEGGQLPHRPVPYYSFALNRWINRGLGLPGNDVRSFHAVNLALHLANAGLIAYIACQSLRMLHRGRESEDEQAPAEISLAGGRDAAVLAWCIAGLWAVHPISTQAVTYIYQRMEVLAAFFMLVTLACFVKSLPRKGPRKSTRLRLAWMLASVLACALAMGSKETAAVTPLMVLLYLWLVAGAGSKPLTPVLQKRWPYFASLFATWLIIVAILYRQRGMYPEMGSALSKRVTYALNQPWVILDYLRLSLWPSGLVFDGDWRQITSWPVLAAGLVLLAAVAVGVLRSWRRWPGAAFLIVGFLLLLSPTSSILPASGNRASLEYRMYLPLALVSAGCVLLLSQALKRIPAASARSGGRLALPVLGLVLGSALAWTTFERNKAYASPQALWSDTLQKQPWNRRALTNLVSAWQRQGREDLILRLYDQLGPGIHDHLPSLARRASLLKRAGRLAEAAETSRRALALAQATIQAEPENAMAWFQLGNLVREQDPAAALQAYRKSVELDRFQADARANLGAMLARDQPVEAEQLYREALRIDPTHADAHANLGLLLARRGEYALAKQHLEAALKSNPNHSAAATNFKAVLQRMGS